MADLAVFPDVHDVVRLAVLDLCPQIYAPRIPDKLQDLLPVLRIRRYGGGSDRFTDTARVDVEAYAATYPAARDLAEAVRQRLINTPLQTASGSIDACSVETGPFELSYSDPDTRLLVATYRLGLRR